MSASVIAFAQSEMVSLFMNGIDDDYADFVSSFTSQAFATGFPDTIGTTLDKYLNKADKAKVIEGFVKLEKNSPRNSARVYGSMPNSRIQTRSLRSSTIFQRKSSPPWQRAQGSPAKSSGPGRVFESGETSPPRPLGHPKRPAPITACRRTPLQAAKRPAIKCCSLTKLSARGISG